MEMHNFERPEQLIGHYATFQLFPSDESPPLYRPAEHASHDRAVHDPGNLLQVVSSGIRIVERCIREKRGDDALAFLGQVNASVHRADGLARATLHRGGAIFDRRACVGVANFARGLGGQASLESTSAKGTSIALYLPCAAADGEQSPPSR